MVFRASVSKLICLLLSVAMVAFVAVSWALVEADDHVQTPKANTVATQAHASKAEARRQAELLHTSFAGTLSAIHHEYYRSDQGMTIPAVTLKSVFRDLERNHKLEFRWLAINAQAMNVDHQPKSDFEKEAAKSIAAGADQFEGVEEGVYRRVGAIALQSECLKCHLPNRTSNKNRLAGLMISIPIQANE
ncbi:c-type heme family protein [Schlesneria paludicola]|uniref:c-type heme family protein n=1 Tax=Schlesneria paludicola TaxID=360056 RepID=UPI00029B4740|nr:DUF3365 domain-containing protein [Schlesneria paludicola]